MEKQAPAGAGQGVGAPRQRMGGRDLCYCPKDKITVPHERGIPCVDQKCPQCDGKLVPFTGQEIKTKKDYKGQELCICTVCGAKYKRLPKVKCEELYCRRCGSRLSPYIGTTER